MSFNFSIRNAIKHAWQLFTERPFFFGTLAFVLIIFNIFSQSHTGSLWLFIIVGLATVLWSFVWISVALTAVDGKGSTLTFQSLSTHMPNGRQYLMMLLITIVLGALVAFSFLLPILLGVFIATLITFIHSRILLTILFVLGFLILLIPGVYITTRVSFAITSYVDRQGTLAAAFQHSWNMVNGKIFWTVFLVLMIEGVFLFLGSLLIMVGLLVAYPITILMFTQLYRALSTRYYHETHIV